MTTIYKIDSKDKLRYLTIYTEGNLVVQTSGIVGSENPVTHKSECKGKNIGKVNETTPESQALSEAQAKLTKKLSEGYYESIELAQGGGLILPMLAKDFNEFEKKVTYPSHVQPKLDGMRSLKDQKTFTSRKNKVIDTMRHIEEELLGIEYILDGELYAHGRSFQENMSLIKKYREGETESIKYHVYDLVIPNLNFEERLWTLRALMTLHNPTHIELVPTYTVNNKEELLEYHKQFLSEGFEGTIVRWGTMGYEPNKRSNGLLKFKDFQDIACRIVDVEPSEKRPTQATFVCELEDGTLFKTGMRFSFKEREEFLQNKEKYIGEIGEIRFFEYTDEGVPRFPVCVGFRLDK